MHWYYNKNPGGSIFPKRQELLFIKKCAYFANIANWVLAFYTQYRRCFSTYLTSKNVRNVTFDRRRSQRFESWTFASDPAAGSTYVTIWVWATNVLHTNSIHWWESVFPNKTKYYSHEGQRGCRYEWSTPVKVFCLLREWDDVVQTVCHLCQETVGRSVTTVPPALSDAPKHEEAVTENHLDAARCSASEVGGHFFGDEY